MGYQFLLSDKLLGALNTIFILFPWALLLFIYRKRDYRAKQIYDDLIRLDPNRELLDKALKPDQRQLPGLILSPDGPEDREDRDKRAIIEQLANQTFSNFEYVLNLLSFSMLIAVGWYFIFYPEASLNLTQLVRQGGGVRELTFKIVENLTPLTIGFAGAYFYVIQMLVRRYLANDLYPSAYLQASLRLLMIFILSLALSLLPFSNPDEATELGLNRVVLLFAFVVGIFPHWGLRYIISWVSRAINSEKPDHIEDVPLNRLDGISIWTEERLAQRGIDNIQSLATASIERLVVGTPFSTAQIVDWIDQAILYIHTVHQDNNWFTAFQATGIRSASDLLDASVKGWAGSILQGSEDFTPEEECLTQIVRAANEARGLPGGDPPAPQAEFGSSNGGSDSARAGQNQKIRLTQAILKVMCEAIWPDPNIKYILNYYQPVTQVKTDSQNEAEYGSSS